MPSFVPPESGSLRERPGLDDLVPDWSRACRPVSTITCTHSARRYIGHRDLAFSMLRRTLETDGATAVREVLEFDMAEMPLQYVLLLPDLWIDTEHDRKWRPSRRRCGVELSARPSSRLLPRHRVSSPKDLADCLSRTLDSCSHWPGEAGRSPDLEGGTGVHVPVHSHMAPEILAIEFRTGLVTFQILWGSNIIQRGSRQPNGMRLLWSFERSSTTSRP